MLEYSDIFKNDYVSEDSVFILNQKQAGLYIKHHVTLRDIFWSDDRLIYVFDKKSSQDAYEKWKKHELN